MKLVKIDKLKPFGVYYADDEDGHCEDVYPDKRRGVAVFQSEETGMLTSASLSLENDKGFKRDNDSLEKEINAVRANLKKYGDAMSVFEEINVSKYTYDAWDNWQIAKIEMEMLEKLKKEIENSNNPRH